MNFLIYYDNNSHSAPTNIASWESTQRGCDGSGVNVEEEIQKI